MPREVRDRDYFYLWSFATWGLWAGLGLGAIWQWTAQAIGKSSARAWQLASPVLLIALIPLVTNAKDAPRTGQTFTADWARDLLQLSELQEPVRPIAAATMGCWRHAVRVAWLSGSLGRGREPWLLSGLAERR